MESIESWIKEEYEALEDFRRYWLENNVVHPEYFPMHMDLGEWDEQFRAWQSSR